RRAMHAQEPVGIEPLLEVLEGIAQEVLLPARVDLDVVAGGLEPLDVGDAHEVHGLAAADGDAPLRAALGADRCEQREKFAVDAYGSGPLQLLQRMVHRPGEARASAR